MVDPPEPCSTHSSKTSLIAEEMMLQEVMSGALGRTPISQMPVIRVLLVCEKISDEKHPRIEKKEREN